MTTAGPPGRPRPAVAALPAYRPGRAADAAMREHGLDHLVDVAVKLASNELPYPPLPAAIAAIEAAAGDGSCYPDHRAAELRAALGAATGLPDERVAVGCGSVGLLQQLALTYLDAGDPVVYATPSFEAYPVYAALVGATAVEVPLRRQTIDLDAVAAAVDHRTKLVLVADPNNPTGTAVGTDAVRALLEAVPRTCVVVLDEAYREFVDAAHVDDTVGLLAEFDHLVILRTFSKAYALASLRVGYALGHPEVIAAIDRTLVPFAVNGLGQRAALASLAAGDELRERVGTVVAERRRVATALRRLGWSVPVSQANFVWLPAGAATTDLAVALEHRGVVTRPFPGLGIRVTIGSPDANDRFLAAFDQAVTGLDPQCWALPTGDQARRVQHTLDRLAERDHVLLRLDDHAASDATDRLLAQLAEIEASGVALLRAVVDGERGDPPSDPPPAGSTPAGRVRRDSARLAAEIAQLEPADWQRRLSHRALGTIDPWRVVDELVLDRSHHVVGQLDGLRRG